MAGRRTEDEWVGTNADGSYDELAVQLVVDGYSMPLDGADRTEAIRRMGERGVTRVEMARRLRMADQDAVSSWTRRHGVKLGTTVRPAHWTVQWLERKRRRGNSEEWKDGRFDGSSKMMRPGT